jgi:hypothetical protein
MSDYTNIVDFSDLGQPFQFKYNNNVYQIPVIPPKIAKQLIEMGREISTKASVVEKQIKEYEDKGEKVPDELYSELGTAFDFQVNFISETGIKKVNSIDDTLIDVSKEEISNTWSTKLVIRVFNQINKLLMGDESEQEKKS